ncbi:MAG TPA: hypothetical protein VES92_07320, partial [Nitrospiraceae bacterium]|nr:hypothetical protein [Nitrospiraceae bacterium]
MTGRALSQTPSRRLCNRIGFCYRGPFSGAIYKENGRYMATNDKQVIFSLVNVGKVYPPKRQVLR